MACSADLSGFDEFECASDPLEKGWYPGEDCANPLQIHVISMAYKMPTGSVRTALLDHRRAYGRSMNAAINLASEPTSERMQRCAVPVLRLSEKASCDADHPSDIPERGWLDVLAKASDRSQKCKSTLGSDALGPFDTCAGALAWLEKETPDLAAELVRRGAGFVLWSAHLQDKRTPHEFMDAVWVKKPSTHTALLEALTSLKIEPYRQQA
jgi:hypothetical protein